MQANSGVATEDEAALRRVLPKMWARRPPDEVLNMILRSWDALAREVEGKYTDDIYEYTNDLGARDLLEEALSAVSPAAQRELRAAIEPADTRFIENTREVKTPLSPDLRGRGLGWWWYRVPATHGTKILSALREQGIL